MCIKDVVPMRLATIWILRGTSSLGLLLEGGERGSGEAQEEG